MQNIQLYIEGQRIDLFKDESITITDTIKNVKDVSKVFTEFSRTFNLPASKTNNRIFKHYYNNDIVNGYDARVRVKANIELNFLPFKDGYIKLEGVDLKDNKAHTYRITFFGNTLSLKNLISEDQLSDLDWLNNFSTIYSKDYIEEYLTTSKPKTVDGITYVEPIQVPLITHSQRLYYNDVGGGGTHAKDGNLFYHWGDGGSHQHGVKYNELKYALKLPLIIKAIEEKYPQIKFSDDFFNNASNDTFNDLYMWLHRTKGKVTNGLQLNEYSTNVEFNYQYDEYDNGNAFVEQQGGYLTIHDPALFTENREISVRIEPTGTQPYSFRIDRSDGFGSAVTIYESGSITGVGTWDEVVTDLILEENNVGAIYQLYITVGQSTSFNLIRMKYEFDDGDTEFYELFYNLTNETIQAVFNFEITEQIPKMKILEFLTGLFKMFNLVAYVDGDEIVVKTLDSFYNTNNEYDITEYVDVSKSQSNSALPFREVVYSYSGLKSFLAAQHEQLFNQEWATTEYRESNDKVFSGEIFKYTLPFEHFKFERLLDLNGGATTDIQWGYSVTDTQESYLGKPFLFYIQRKTQEISYVDGVDATTNLPNSHTDIQNFFIPTNSNQNITPFADQPSINFKSELDEWETSLNENTLFNDYHKNYISSVFNKSNRITKVTAYLPLRVLLNYKLSDRFLISGKSYKINSITTNFQNGKSEIELLNDL